MAEANSTAHNPTQSVPQSAYAESAGVEPERVVDARTIAEHLNRAPFPVSLGGGLRHAGPLIDFIGDRWEAQDERDEGKFGVMVMFLDADGRVLHWTRERWTDQPEHSWFIGWGQLYPRGRAHALRHLVEQAIQVGASHIAFASDAWDLDADFVWSDVAQITEEIDHAIAPLDLHVLDFFLIGASGIHHGMALSGYERSWTKSARRAA